MGGWMVRARQTEDSARRVARGAYWLEKFKKSETIISRAREQNVYKYVANGELTV